MSEQGLKKKQRQEQQRNTAYWLDLHGMLNRLALPAEGWHYSQWDGPCYVDHESRKCITDLLIGQADGVNSSFEIFPFQLTLVYTKLTKTNQNKQEVKTETIFTTCIGLVVEYNLRVDYGVLHLNILNVT